MSDVSSPLLDFTLGWIQTLSTYDVLMARFFKMLWASNHLPVLSRRGHNETCFTTFHVNGVPQPVPIAATPDPNNHTLITGFNLGVVGGRAVRCPIAEHKGIGFKQTKSQVRITCKQCQSKCTVPQFKTSTTTPLGTQGLVALNYPLDQYPARWELSTAALATRTLYPSIVTPPLDSPTPGSSRPNPLLADALLTKHEKRPPPATKASPSDIVRVEGLLTLGALED